MSGPFGSSQLMYATGAAAEEGQSLRFEDGGSAYLSRTPASAGNRKTWTWSGWVKRGNLGINTRILGTSYTSLSEFYIRFKATDAIEYGSYEGGGASNNFQLITTQVFRDPSAWLHITFVWDTSEATASNRVKFYINGEQVTSFSTSNYPTLNYNGIWNNSTHQHRIGFGSSTNHFDGYLANVTFIDGQALTPTSFGEYDDTLWKPKDVSGLTFGTNGFFLDFSDSSAIGDDTSGNSNDWTPNNLAATDVVLDSPVTGGNFAMLNPLDKVGISLSQGNLKTTATAASFQAVRSTITYPSGSWYVEVRSDAGIGNGNSTVGITRVSDALSTMTGSNIVGASSTAWSYASNGNIYNSNAVDTATGTTWSAGSIISVAFDGSSVKFYKDNSLVHTESSLTGDYVLTLGAYSTDAMTANFGQDSSFAGNETPQGNTDDNGQGDFYYAPPSGFLALTTGNLPAATITAPDEYFNTVLYTGDGVDDRAITGVGFQPDWVWLKTRSVADNHVLNDSVRGGNRQLFSNTTDQEFTSTTLLKTFDSDGFTLGTDSSVNGSGRTLVAWNWKAGGTAVSNTDGSITSQVSANTDAGFSIVSWESTTSTSDTVGHGLSSPPELIFTKNREIAQDWWSYTTAVDGTHDGIRLNLTNAAFDSSSVASPTATVFSNVNTGGAYDNIAYCFHSVESYSKCGVYTGNGSTDGTFVHLGFRPAFLLLKNADTGVGSYDWFMFDDKRNSSNAVDNYVRANSSAAEANFDLLDFTSNGFKLRTNSLTLNKSGDRFIFLAFAEAPFKSANAR